MSQFKVVVVGDKHSGKTCTLMSFFNESLLPEMIEDAPLVFNQSCRMSHKGKDYSLVLWDISCSQVQALYFITVNTGHGFLPKKNWGWDWATNRFDPLAYGPGVRPLY